KRGRGKFKERHVHERIFVDGPVGQLQNPMHHLAYTSVDEFQKAMDKYARLSAEEFQQDGSIKWRANPLNEMLHPPWTFFVRYIMRLGFLDGKLGLELSLIYSQYVRDKIKLSRLKANER